MPNTLKCDCCDKNLTKKVPGLECRSCGKIVHASQACTGLSTKQISVLRNADNIDWTCADCQKMSPQRKSSFIVPEEEDDEELISCEIGKSFDVDKFLKDITVEMKKVFKKELQLVETSLSECCSKIDDLTKTVALQNAKITELDNKYSQLRDKHDHMELELTSLKQYVRRIDQFRLDNVIEVTGIPIVQDENLDAIACQLANTLKLDNKQVNYVKRVPPRTGRAESIIQVGLKLADQADHWVRTAKKSTVLLGNIINKAPTDVAKSEVKVRRALTGTNKSLLWEAKQNLTPTYKYIWFQNGKVLTRKTDNDKSIVINSGEDIKNLASYK